MKKIGCLLSLLIVINSNLFSQTSSLVNYDYSYTVDYNTKGTIVWSNFPDFSLPDNYKIIWENVFALGAWDDPLKKGFSHTHTIANQLGYEYHVSGGTTAPWDVPMGNRYLDVLEVAGKCGLIPSSYEYVPGTYTDMFDRFQYRYLTGQKINSIYPSGSPCYEFPGGFPFSYTIAGQTNFNNSSDVAKYPVFADSSGNIVKNIDVVGLDFEQVFNIERYHGNAQFQSFLDCIQDPACNSGNSPFPQGGVFGIDHNRGYIPSSTSTLSQLDFKKLFYKIHIKNYYAAVDAFRSISSISEPFIMNYSTNVEDPYALDTATDWNNVLTHPDYLSFWCKDTTNFSSYGNHYTAQLDAIGPDVYDTYGGRLYEWKDSSGMYMIKYLSLFELNTHYAHNDNKECITYVSLTNDEYKDNSLPGYAQNYLRTSPSFAEGSTIWPIMCGADGLVLWEIGQDWNLGYREYEFAIKGLHRLSKFNHFLSDSSRQYVYEKDPIQFRTEVYNNLATYSVGSNNWDGMGIWRGIVSGDSILVAAMNPFAPNDTYQTTLIVNYGGWSDTITLIGRNIFLGTARWNDGNLQPELTASITTDNFDECSAYNGYDEKELTLTNIKNVGGKNIVVTLKAEDITANSPLSAFVDGQFTVVDGSNTPIPFTLSNKVQWERGAIYPTFPCAGGSPANYLESVEVNIASFSANQVIKIKPKMEHCNCNLTYEPTNYNFWNLWSYQVTYQDSANVAMSPITEQANGGINGWFTNAHKQDSILTISNGQTFVFSSERTNGLNDADVSAYTNMQSKLELTVPNCFEFAGATDELSIEGYDLGNNPVNPMSVTLTNTLPSGDKVYEAIFPAQSGKLLNEKIKVNLGVNCSVGSCSQNDIEWKLWFVFNNTCTGIASNCWLPGSPKMVFSPVIQGCQTTEILDISTIDFKLYPNPAANELNILLANSNKLNKLEIQILDAANKQVKQVVFQQQTIDVSRLAKGFYTLKLKSNGVVVGMKTFIKE